MILLLSFWIAEWGVIRTDADFLGPSCHQRYLWLPIEMDIRKLGIILDKPVIYFYGELPETLILHLGLSEIGIAYPPPHDSTNGFTWLIKKPKGRYYPDYKHRLALRFDMLEREADFLLIGDSTIRFIYYDAPMVYDDSLDVIFSDSGALARIVSKLEITGAGGVVS